MMGGCPDTDSGSTLIKVLVDGSRSIEKSLYREVPLSRILSIRKRIGMTLVNDTKTPACFTDVPQNTSCFDSG